MAGKSKANGAVAGNGWGGPRANSGGARVGAGKPKGSRSAKTLRKEATLARAAAKQLMPVEFLLAQMRDPKNPLDVRLECAKWAAPYVSPRLSSVEIVKSIRAMSREELKYLIRDAQIGEPSRCRAAGCGSSMEVADDGEGLALDPDAAPATL